jgi:hypothetical protein
LTRRDRILLLLATYPDVADMQQQVDHGRASGKPGYRHLVREGLWAKGSYADLERCLERMLERGYRSIHWHIVELYVRRNPTGKARRRKADAGLDLLVKWMPSDINIPVELIDNAELLGNPLALTYLKRKQAA